MPTLQEALGYRTPTPNRVQRALHSAASNPAGAWVMSKTLEPMDKLTLKLSGGRWTAAGLVGALPVITLTTTGVKTGLPRTSPLLGIPLDGRLAIIGTNYGQKATPGWVYNLEANPRAAVSHRTTTVDAIARPAHGEEFEEAFRRSALVYPGYERYRERIDGRRIRVFTLDLA